MRAVRKVRGAYKKAPEVGADVMIDMHGYLARDGWTEEELMLWEGLKRWMALTEATRIGVEHAIRMLGCGDIDNRLNATVNGYKRAFASVDAWEGESEGDYSGQAKASTPAGAKAREDKAA